MANKTADRNWQIDADPFMVDDDEAIGEAVFEAVRILTRIGGAIIIAANREEVAPEHYVTTGIMMRWTSYAPAKRLPKDEPQAEEPVAGEVAA